MSIVNTLALESNRQIKINFDGGALSSDAGLLLIKEFISKLGIDTLLEKAYQYQWSCFIPISFGSKKPAPNDIWLLPVISRMMPLMNWQMILYSSLYLKKDALASEPTVSRFFNRMDEETLKQFLAVARVLRRKIYSIQMPQAVILDLDSTLLDAYGRQEGRAFNFHY